MVGFAKRLLPYSAPMKPPNTAASTQYGKWLEKIGDFKNTPAKPEIEFTKINAAATPEITLVFSHLKNSSSGLKNTPPPMPVSPESKPKRRAYAE